MEENIETKLHIVEVELDLLTMRKTYNNTLLILLSQHNPSFVSLASVHVITVIREGNTL